MFVCPEGSRLNSGEPFPLSILSLSIAERIKLAHNTNSSRVYDVLLESSTVPLQTKRRFVMDFIGHYHLLADDRFGSRIAERCWAFADTYLKVDILSLFLNVGKD